MGCQALSVYDPPKCLLGLRTPPKKEQADRYGSRSDLFKANMHADTLLKTEVDKLLKRHQRLNQLDMARVVSHVQRETDGWVLNTIMLEGYDVAFKYSRRKRYRSLKGARVNLTYYPQSERVSGMEIEVMKVVRLKRA